MRIVWNTPNINNYTVITVAIVFIVPSTRSRIYVGTWRFAGKRVSFLSAKNGLRTSRGRSPRIVDGRNQNSFPRSTYHQKFFLTVFISSVVVTHLNKNSKTYLYDSAKARHRVYFEITDIGIDTKTREGVGFVCIRAHARHSTGSECYRERMR